jgi:acetyl-CoA acetyltransferase
LFFTTSLHSSNKCNENEQEGSVTAASSSALTDGASACLIMSEEKAAELGYSTDIVVRSFATTAIEPFPQLLLAPAVAIPEALKRAGLTVRVQKPLSHFQLFCSA